jgi:fatty acid synthase
MSIFLKNTTFHGILLDSLFENASEDWLRVHQLLEQGIENGVVQPLQSNVFNANEIEQAFRFMSQGKHMGKVVIKVKRFSYNSSEFSIEILIRFMMNLDP